MKPPSRVWVAALVAVVVVVGLFIVGPCGGGEGADGRRPGGDGTTASPGKPDPLRAQGERVAAEVLGGGQPERPVGSVQGTVQTSNGPQPAVAEVLSVEVTAEAVLLRWRLKTTGPLVDLAPEALTDTQPQTHASGVVLVDPAAQKLARPARFKERFGFHCACSETPDEIDGKGQVLTGLYPPLAPDTRQVEVRIPGFPPITNVVVTRG